MITALERHLGSFMIITLMAVIALCGCAGLRADCSTGKSSDAVSVAVDPAFSAKERLGKLLFFETSLSTPPGQACSTCHAPEVAFADPELGLPVSRGGKRPVKYG